jgi:hypothetical protein
MPVPIECALTFATFSLLCCSALTGCPVYGTTVPDTTNLLRTACEQRTSDNASSMRLGE